MICKYCADSTGWREHDECKGETWCDCQHKPSLVPSTPADQVLTLEGIKTQEAHGEM